MQDKAASAGDLCTFTSRQGDWAHRMPWPDLHNHQSLARKLNLTMHPLIPIIAGLPPYDQPPTPPPEDPTPQSSYSSIPIPFPEHQETLPPKPKMLKLSFDEYYETWKKKGTSICGGKDGELVRLCRLFLGFFGSSRQVYVY